MHDFTDRLIPNGGKGLLGHWAFCKACEGRAYTRKNESVWQIVRLPRGALLEFPLIEVSMFRTRPLALPKPSRPSRAVGELPASRSIWP